MTDLESLPLFGRAYRIGVHPVTTTLVLLGPPVIALLAVVGRHPVATVVAVLYVLAVPAGAAYVRLSGAGESRDEDGD